jgi:hypothetical protein
VRALKKRERSVEQTWSKGVLSSPHERNPKLFSSPLHAKWGTPLEVKGCSILEKRDTLPKFRKYSFAPSLSNSFKKFVRLTSCS